MPSHSYIVDLSGNDKAITESEWTAQKVQKKKKTISAEEISQRYILSVINAV